MSNGSQNTSTALNTASAVVPALFSLAAASNAVPIAGQAIGVALAIAGGLTQVFMGKRQAQRSQDQQIRRQGVQRSLVQAGQPVNSDPTPMLQPQGQEPVQPTAPVNPPLQPVYQGYNQPVQQPAYQAPPQNLYGR